MFWKSLVGETMLAAVLVDRVAMMINAIASATHIGLWMWPISVTGSDTVTPTSFTEAAVITTPREANRNMVSGRPKICPRIWSFWLFA
ncbi:hypothetical protein FQZ97_1037650 [compost metagenome]